MPVLVVVPYTADVGDVAQRLSDGDRTRLRGLTDDDARRRLLAGRTALLEAAARAGEPGIRIDARCPDCGLSHGRPTAEGAAAPLHMALAHAGGHAFATASRHPIGIDAEPEDTPAERRAAVEALAPGRGDPLRRWTAIEAVLKADGRGLRVAPEAVEFRFGGARLGADRYRLRSTTSAGCVVAIAERR